MHSITFGRGLRTDGPSFASSEINDPLDVAHILRQSIEETYERHAGRVFGSRSVKSAVIKPPPVSMSQDGIRTNLVSLAKHQGRADALGMIEMARLDEEHRSSIHNLKKTIQDAITRNKEYTASAVKKSQFNSSRYSDKRISEARDSIKASVAALNDNVRVLNREPDLIGQVREAINAVSLGNRAPQQQAARAALQEMADSSTHLTQFGAPLEDVPSRLERIAYVSTRNTALAMAGVKNLEKDVVEHTAKLAALSLNLHASLGEAFSRAEAIRAQATRDTHALQDHAESETSRHINSLQESLATLEKNLRQRIDQVVKDLRSEQTSQNDNHHALIDSLNTKMIEFYTYVEGVVDFLQADNRSAISENNTHLAQQFQTWETSRSAAEQARDTDISLLRAQHDALHERIRELEQIQSHLNLSVIDRPA